MKESLVAKAVRGFFILLPFLIAYLMVGQLVDMLVGNVFTRPVDDIQAALQETLREEPVAVEA